MNAEPLLHQIASAPAENRLEAVMVDGAAAAIQGAPVTTLDFDFMFRKTPANLKKLKGVADSLRAMILRPYHPVSDLYRVVNDELGLQLDFIDQIRRLLALPMNKRTHFLRVRRPGGGFHL